MNAATEHPEGGPSPDELMARAGWPTVQTALLRGLAHDLSGRAAALGGLVELLRLGDDHEEPPLVDLLSEESARLGEAVGRIRLLSSDGEDDPPEPLSLEPLLVEILRLHARHRGLESVETMLDVGDDVPPVRVRRGLLVKALLLLLGAAGWAVRNAGERRLEVGLLRRDDRAAVTLGLPAGGADGQTAPEGGSLRGPDLEGARQGAEAALQGDGATVRRIEDGDGRSRLELQLPALRRRES